MKSLILAIQPWFLAARPKTLTAAFVPILVSVGYARFLKPSIEYWIPITALLCSILIQIATNFYNDAIDFKKGADTARRLGPKRASNSGLIKPKDLIQAAHFCLFVTTVIGALLVIRGGPWILGVGLFSMLFSYAYTGGPYPLAYKGWGDFFVLLFFGWIAFLGMSQLLLGSVTIESFVLGTQVGCLAATLIVINNYRDMNLDREVGKMTLAARFGVLFTRIEFTFLVLIPYLLNIYLASLGRFKPAIFSSLLLPVAAYLVYKLLTSKPSAELNRILALAALHHLMFGLLLTLGYLFLQ